MKNKTFLEELEEKDREKKKKQISFWGKVVGYTIVISFIIFIFWICLISMGYLGDQGVYGYLENDTCLEECSQFNHTPITIKEFSNGEHECYCKSVINGSLGVIAVKSSEGSNPRPITLNELYKESLQHCKDHNEKLTEIDNRVYKCEFGDNYICETRAYFLGDCINPFEKNPDLKNQTENSESCDINENCSGG